MSCKQFCNTCTFWDKLAPSVSASGICSNEAMKQQVKVNYCDADMDAEGTHWTEPFFGCIHHRENVLAVVILPKIKQQL